MPRSSPRSPWFLRIITGLVLTAVGAQVALYAYEDLSWRMEPDLQLQQDRCGSCHDADLPRTFAKSPSGWRRTVEAMIGSGRDGRPRPAASAAVKERIAGLLIRRRSAGGDLLFKLRCGSCHSTSRLDPYASLSPGALSLLVKQHVLQYNHAVQTWEGRLIAEAVLARRSKGDGSKSARSARIELLYEKACGSCHTVSFRYRTMCPQMTTDKGWTALVNRMREKAPVLVSREDLQPLTARARRICAR